MVSAMSNKWLIQWLTKKRIAQGMKTGRGVEVEKSVCQVQGHITVT